MRSSQTRALPAVDDVALRIVRHAMEAFDRGDRAGFRLALADNAVERDDAAEYVLRGSTAITEALWAMRELFPRIEVEINQVNAHPDEAGVEIAWCDQSRTALVAPGEESTTMDAGAPMHDRTIFSVRDGMIAVISHESRFGYPTALSQKSPSERGGETPAAAQPIRVVTRRFAIRRRDQ